MMKFNLNETVNSVAVFNNGLAGRVDDVTIEIVKRKPEEPDTYPNFKLVVNDGSGATPINKGIYFNENDEETVQKRVFTQVKSIADSVVPENFVYPQEEMSYVSAINMLINIINEHSKNAKVDVFVTYGYKSKPSKYLGLRNYNFIQRKNSKVNVLIPQASDILERPMPDAPVDSDNSSSSNVDEIAW